MEDFSHNSGPKTQTTVGIIVSWLVRLIIFAFVIYQIYLGVSGEGAIYVPTPGSLNPDQADAIKYNWANVLVFHVVSKETANENDPALTFDETKKVLNMVITETTTVNKKETKKSLPHRVCTEADFGTSDLAKEYFKLFEGQLLLCPSNVKEETPPITDVAKWKALTIPG